MANPGNEPLLGGQPRLVVKNADQGLMEESESGSSSSSSSDDGEEDNREEDNAKTKEKVEKEERGGKSTEVGVQASPLADVEQRAQAHLENLEKLSADIKAADQQLSSFEEKASGNAVSNWKKGKHAVLAQVRVKKNLIGFAQDVKKKREMKASLYLLIVVALSVAETESKAAVFHMKAVGKYSDRIDGKPYTFSYTMFVTMLVFAVKLGLAPLEHLLKPKKVPHHKHHEKEKKKDRQPFSVKTSLKKMKTSVSSLTFKDVWNMAAPWLLLFSFTFLEMVSTSLANYGLTLTPTSIYVVCKTSKILFVAIMSVVILGSKLRGAQYASLALLSISLLISVIAEKSPKSKHVEGTLLEQLMGPITLVASELFHASMLVAQQIAVQYYWHDGLQLVSYSALIGIPTTILSMQAASYRNTSSPPYHPVNDTSDVFVMAANNPTLGIAILLNLVCHVAMDVSHILCLKYMSSLARSISDAIKLAIMWVLGKSFWFMGQAIYKEAWPKGGGTLNVLAEPMHPHSYLMIPALAMIGYSMLMFKFRSFLPVQYLKQEDGKRHICLVAAELTQEEKDNQFLVVDTGIDDKFYTNVFHNRKIRKVLKKNLAGGLQEVRQQVAKGKGNLWQVAALRASLDQSAKSMGKDAKLDPPEPA